jgi:glutamate-1-semialdehyde aminotransferase
MSDATAADLTDLLTPRHEGIDLVRLRRLAEKERERYVERTPRSRDLSDRAEKHLIGGVMSSWHTDWHLPHPLYVERSKDNRVWDVDGNEYVDFNLGDTPDMFGHAPDIWVAGKAVAGGIPCAVYGMSAEIGEGLAAVLARDDPQGPAA